MDSPRSSLALLSPSTQRTASMMLDLPQPLGPTTPTSCPGSWKVVGSAKDLKPESLMEFSRMESGDLAWLGPRAFAKSLIHMRSPRCAASSGGMIPSRPSRIPLQT
jgi:hypothetical protein